MVWYVKKTKNAIADALSRKPLELSNDNNRQIKEDIKD
jgi:hypothetical protein